jgi:hypothetical protein
MRIGLAILLVVLLAGVQSAEATECCDHSPSMSTQCDHEQARLCLDLECRPAFAAAISPVVASWPVLAGKYDAFQRWSAGRAAPSDSVVLRLVSGRLFLRNRVLLI